MKFFHCSGDKPDWLISIILIFNSGLSSVHNQSVQITENVWMKFLVRNKNARIILLHLN